MYWLRYHLNPRRLNILFWLWLGDKIRFHYENREQATKDYLDYIVDAAVHPIIIDEGVIKK